MFWYLVDFYRFQYFTQVYPCVRNVCKNETFPIFNIHYSSIHDQPRICEEVRRSTCQNGKYTF